jgi:hypothetical protein
MPYKPVYSRGERLRPYYIFAQMNGSLKHQYLFVLSA